MKRPARAAPEAWEGRKPVETIFLTLPRPPSVNGLYKNVPGHGRAPTKLYRQWIVAASTEVMMQRPGCVRGTYHIEIVCERSNDQADLNNLWKAVEDALKSWGVIQDDRLCISSAARWRGRGRAMTVRVTATKGDCDGEEGNKAEGTKTKKSQETETPPIAADRSKRTA